MPVKLLLCEGGSKSPDIRLISAILGRSASVRPAGGKSNFRDLVKAVRTHIPSCAAFADRDFPRDPSTWALSDDACTWQDQGEFIGWTWQRKEIENYLVDPEVLRRTFAWDAAKVDAYRDRLSDVATRIALPTAARMSLTVHAPRKSRLDTSVPIDFLENRLREVLSSRAQQYSAGATIHETALLDTFDALKPQCADGGALRPHALALFAGKDLMCALNHMSEIRTLQPELANRPVLEETVLLSLETSLDPHTWLPEWQSLRDAVDGWTP